MVMNGKEDLWPVFKANYLNGDDIEYAIAAIRKAGATQIDTIRLIMKELDTSLSEADQLVINSKTWADCAEATCQLRKDFQDATETDT